MKTNAPRPAIIPCAASAAHALTSRPSLVEYTVRATPNWGGLLPNTADSLFPPCPRMNYPDFFGRSMIKEGRQRKKEPEMKE